ncbi:hypothetical protein C0991_007438 [Blastosporella zonata]|nr:hypothetical protein C0991_007438 [Blastosporella zonata]
MTEYDFSQEAYDRYFLTQHRIANWLEATEGHRSEFGNALPVPPSVASSHIRQIGGKHLDPLKNPLRSSQSQYTHTHVPTASQPPPRNQSRAPSRQPSAANLHALPYQQSGAEASLVAPVHLAPPQSQHPRTVSKPASYANLNAAHSQTAVQMPNSVPAPQPHTLGGPSHNASIVNLRSQHPQHASGVHASQALSAHVATHSKTLSHHHSSGTLREPTGVQHTFQASTAHAAAHPKTLSHHHSSATLRIPSEHHSQHTVRAPASQKSPTAVTTHSKTLAHHNSSVTLRESSQQIQAPQSAYVVRVPPSKGPTYVYTAPGSVGLVVLPPSDQETSIMISPQSHVQGSQAQLSGYSSQPRTLATSASSHLSLASPQTQQSHTQVTYPYAPLPVYQAPVIIIEHERRSKSASGRRNKKKDKRS